jgi:hypothetical protein
MTEIISTYSAFAGPRCLAAGPLDVVAAAAKKAHDAGEQGPILLFVDDTGRPLELDLRGSWEEACRRLQPLPPTPAAVDPDAKEAHRGPGRPKLGVVAREVTLLPRHWDWLSTQPGGASVALRKLIEEARKSSAGKDRVRAGQEAAYRILSAVAGNLPGFEEATRALFAGRKSQFDDLVSAWPENLPEHARRLAAAAFSADEVRAQIP